MRFAGFAVVLICLLVPAPFAWAQDFGPVTDRDFLDRGRPDPDTVELGRLLFFDRILSGNRNISCATCHHPFEFTGDGLSLPIGEGARGLGAERDTGKGTDRVHERVPRNAPALFNLGAREFTRMFHDGRVARDRSQASGFTSPAGGDLPAGLDSALAAQAMFPVTSGAEMAGQAGENEVADAAAAGRLAGRRGVWGLLARRLQDIPAYVDLFAAAFDDIDRAGDITMVHAANAIAAFEAATWRADDSPFDRFLRGDKSAMTPSQKAGMRLFYGQARCSGCHTGPFQSDQAFHALAFPQIGPGKGDGPDGRDDFGRERETGRTAHRYQFRTPTLRNVELTAPYGHAGAFATLEAVVRHKVDPVGSLLAYDGSQAVLPSRPKLNRLDFVVMDDPDRVDAIAAANEFPGVALTEGQIGDLLAFLRALTDEAMLDLSDGVPDSVPSGLPVLEDDPR